VKLSRLTMSSHTSARYGTASAPRVWDAGNASRGSPFGRAHEGQNVGCANVVVDE
jgi:hypothetical protein